MAQSRESKESDLAELAELFTNSKLTVVASYTGLGVQQMQELRKQSAESSTRVRVAKNRLVKLALAQNDVFKESDLSAFTGQLLYAFNSEDEVAPAQVLNNFAKSNSELQFVAAINQDGEVFTAEQVAALADLPTKEQLRAQVVGTIAAPLSGLVGVLSGNLRGLANVLNARQEQLESQ